MTEMNEWKRFGLQMALVAFLVFAGLGFAMFVLEIAHRLGY